MSVQQSEVNFGGCVESTTRVKYGKPVKEVWNVDSKGCHDDFLLIIRNGVSMALNEILRIRFFFKKSEPNIFNSGWLDLCCEILREDGKYVEKPMRFVLDVQPLNSEKWVSEIHDILEFQPKDDRREKIIKARFGNLHSVTFKNDPIIRVGFNIVPVYFLIEGGSDYHHVEMLYHQLASKSNVVYDLSMFRGIQNNHSDLEVKTSDGKITLAHAFILAARSPVLRTLLREVNSAGSFRRRIQLSDVDYYTFGTMLRWMYSGELRMTHTALGIDRVQAAAQNYELGDLLQLVYEEKRIISNCNVGNMFKLMEIATKNTMEFAQQHISEFILRNIGTSE